LAKILLLPLAKFVKCSFFSSEFAKNSAFFDTLIDFYFLVLLAILASFDRKCTKKTF